MEELASIKPDSLPVISESEVPKAIKSLNSGKSADEMGLTAEHLKYSGTALLAAIAAVFNEVLRTKAIQIWDNYPSPQKWEGSIQDGQL